MPECLEGHLPVNLVALRTRPQQGTQRKKAKARVNKTPWKQGVLFALIKHPWFTRPRLRHGAVFIRANTAHLYLQPHRSVISDLICTAGYFPPKPSAERQKSIAPYSAMLFPLPARSSSSQKPKTSSSKQNGWRAAIQAGTASVCDVPGSCAARALARSRRRSSMILRKATSKPRPIKAPGGSSASRKPG